MQLSSSDEEGTVPSRGLKRNRSDSESEDGEIDEEHDDAVAVISEPTPERLKVDALVEEQLASGGRDVMQKDARYYLIDNVVCSHCGVKGHLSYDCPEEETSTRCFMCGKTGHSSKDCPNEVCYYCKRTGHRQRDCPERAAGRGSRKPRVERRSIGPSRPPKLRCYVCGQGGHLDCGLAKVPSGVLSCFNCGMLGHAGGGCNMTSVDRVIPIVMEMERERKQNKVAAAKRKGVRGKGAKGDKSGGESANDKGSESDIWKMTPKQYREAFLERARQRRYGRGER